jgi:hypothetical protein
MNVNRFSSIGLLLLIGVFFLSAVCLNEQNYCAAAVVWADNFEDGDISDWTVELGTFSVNDGSLRGSGATNAISHASTIAYGSWTFDAEITGMSSVYVSFLADEISGGISTSCYCLRINRFDMQLLESTNYHNTMIGLYDPADTIAGWLHIEISRSASGHFTISVNGTQQIAITDTTHSASTFFVFYCNTDCALDNIEINNSAGTTTPPNGTQTPVPPGIPGFPIAAIALGLVVPLSLVLISRRRKARNNQ